MKHLHSLLFLLLALCAAGCGGEELNEEEENTVQVDEQKIIRLLSYRHLSPEDTLWQRMESELGYRVKLQQARPQEMLDKLENGSPADVAIFPDLRDAAVAKREGLLQFHGLPGLDSYYKSRLRDDEGYWTGLSRRYPVIVYKTELTEAPSPSFLYLAEPAQRGKVLLPPAEDPILQSIVAAIAVQAGQRAARSWVQSVKANAAESSPVAGGRERLLALANDSAELTIALLDEFAALRNPGTYAELQQAEQLEAVMPKDGEGETHYNLSCAVVPKNGDPRKAAVLIEYLCSQKAQEMYTAVTFQYPANVMALPSEFLLNYMGGIRDDEVSVGTISQYLPVARDILEEAGWPQ